MDLRKWSALFVNWLKGNTDAVFHPGELHFQRWFATRDRALAAAPHILRELNDEMTAMIERQELFFIATADRRGRTDAGVRCGPPGFVRVIDRKTLLFPDYLGNGTFMALGNLHENPYIGMLFIDFEQQQRIRVNGKAEVSCQQELLDQMPGAERVIRVRVEQAFPNCRRFLPRLKKLGDSCEVVEMIKEMDDAGARQFESGKK